MSRKLATRPDSAHTAEREQLIENATLEYLAGVGTFRSWDERVKRGVKVPMDEVSPVLSLYLLSEMISLYSGRIL
jgi:hypothetical protein